MRILDLGLNRPPGPGDAPVVVHAKRLTIWVGDAWPFQTFLVYLVSIPRWTCWPAAFVTALPKGLPGSFQIHDLLSTSTRMERFQFGLRASGPQRKWTLLRTSRPNTWSSADAQGCGNVSHLRS